MVAELLSPSGSGSAGAPAGGKVQVPVVEAATGVEAPPVLARPPPPGPSGNSPTRVITDQGCFPGVEAPEAAPEAIALVPPGDKTFQAGELFAMSRKHENKRTQSNLCLAKLRVQCSALTYTDTTF